MRQIKVNRTKAIFRQPNINMEKQGETEAMNNKK
jgi:hypothetical protein